MADSTLVQLAKKAYFTDLPTFSGLPSEDVHRFLSRLNSLLSSLRDPADSDLLHLVRGKLTHSAGLWFDQHRSDFESFQDFKTAFCDHYYAAPAQEIFDRLTRRQQQRGEPVFSYFHDILNLCHDVDPKMSEILIIRHLLSGIRVDQNSELYRNQSSITTLTEFLRYARIEQSLQNKFHYQNSSDASPSPLSPRDTVATIRPDNQPSLPRNHRFSARSNRFSQPRNNNSPFPPRTNSFRSRPSVRPAQPTDSPPAATTDTTRTPSFARTQQPPPKSAAPSSSSARTPTTFTVCKVCGRNNHRMIDCYHKRPSGCFNCGEKHHVRDCPSPPSFQ